MNIILLFIILSITNVVLSTARQIITVKGNKFTASLAMAIYCAFNNIVVIYTVADFPLATKVAITFLTNLVGVFAVKLIEEKLRKVRLWKIEATINTHFLTPCLKDLDRVKVPYNYIPNIGHHTLLNCYCSTKDDSAAVKAILNDYKAKYFITESKSLI